MDLRLLAVFDEVYKTRSVSRAGENLGLPQTSVSLALARLRRRLGDPLFVRTGEGMLPTPHASALIAPFRQALELLRSAMDQPPAFEAATSPRVFRIAMTDISHLEFLPAMVNRAAVLAPGIRIDVLRITDGTAAALESGDADLAIGYMPELEAGFYQQTLFEDDFACVVRRRAPRGETTKLTDAQFRNARHVVVTAAGTGNEIVEQELRRRGVTRRVVLSLPTLPGLGNLLANTDLIATLPRRVGQTLVKIASVGLVSPPYRIPDVTIKQHWHARYHQDPANRWLRGLVAELFLASTARSAGVRGAAKDTSKGREA